MPEEPDPGTFLEIESTQVSPLFPARDGRKVACSIGALLGLAVLAGQVLPSVARSVASDATRSAYPSVAATASPSETRFSDLSDISSDNIADLKLVFSFRTGSPRGHAGVPQVSGSTLFVLTPFPHALFALDLDPASMGRVKWTYRPKPDGRAEGLSTEGAVNEGPTVRDGRVYLNTLDGHTVALDAETGQVVWDVAVADLSTGATLASSPLVAKGHVLVGNSGDDFGARGWLAALDAATGREIWRRFSTGPDEDVGIGAGFRSFYPGERGRDLGVTSWPPSGWEHGGGGVSGPLLYDADLDLVFGGTGHPAPLSPEQRPGGNRWTSGLFARELATGAMRWFDAINPHDLFGLGATAPSLLVDRDLNGSSRRLLIHPDANGYLYVLDRVTGEILSARPFAPVNATAEIDLKTGAPERDPSKAARFNTMARDVCPASSGAAGGGPAYSPQTGLIYLPVSRLCMDIEARNANYIAGTPFAGANIRLKPPPEGPRGSLVAWDLASGRPAWSLPETFPLAGGVLATAGGLILYGTLDGLFKAVDSRSGRELWRYPVTSGIIGQPTTFRGPDGRQYIAVLAGLGGKLGAARNGIDTRDASALGGAGNVLRDLPKPADESGTLYVFRLP